MNLIIPRRTWVITSFINAGSTAIYNDKQASTITNRRPSQLLRGDNITPESILKRGHSHNDYEQRQPLDSALHHGLSSVEVDVFPDSDKKKLLVGHTRFELNSDRTIDNMYIQPIVEMIRRHILRKHTSTSPSAFYLPRQIQPTFSSKLSSIETPKGSTITAKNERVTQEYPSPSSNNMININNDSLLLLVDFKADPVVSINLLKEALSPLKPFLSKVDRDGKFIKGLVTVFISGNRPKDEYLYDYQDDPMEPSSITSSTTITEGRDIKSSSSSRRRLNLLASSASTHGADRRQRIRGDRYLFIDGRIPDLEKNTPTSITPMISINWNTVRLSGLFGRGISNGDSSVTTMTKNGGDGTENFMRQMVKIAHSQGKILRIWGAPNSQVAWKSMMRSDVDLLSIDDHDMFVDFANRGMW